jgi:hypothetical protein
MMMFKFHGSVKTQGAAAVACSAFVRPNHKAVSPQYEPRNC